MTADLLFRGGLERIDDSRVTKAIAAWELAKPNRNARRSWSREDGLYKCTLTGEGEPIVGTSRLGWVDAEAHAIAIAHSRDYLEQYGAEQYRRLSETLVEMQRIAEEGL